MTKSLVMDSRWLSSFVFSMLLFFNISKAESPTSVFNILNYGAIDDGYTDTSKAFHSAWNKACYSNGRSEILFPNGTYLLNPLILKGPCNGQLRINIDGNLIASTNLKDWYGVDHWITIRDINGLEIGGSGVLDGKGHSAWSKDNCMKDPNCKKLPASLRFDFVKNSIIKDIKLIDSKNVHINIFGSSNIVIQRIRIRTPAESVNTDGIHIGESSNILISDSEISTGDDCVSLSPGVNMLDVNNVKCGPGHGISIGSIGGFPDEGGINGLVFRNCTFIGTQNGLRIKTWAHSHPNQISNITFQHINMTDAFNPIIFDQEYCPSGNCTKGFSSQVQIRDIRFENIWGTSKSKVAVKFVCSKTKPCQNIVLNDINLSYIDGTAYSECSNAEGLACGKQKPASCIKQKGACSNGNPIN